MQIPPRRRTRAVGAVIALLATFVLVAGACASDDDAGSGSGSATTVEQQHIDTLRITYDLAGPRRGGFHLNPAESTVTVGDLGIWHWVYGGLMRPDGQGILVPDLAESVSIPDPNTIEVNLRSGIMFPDGTPLDAAAAKAGIERNKAHANNTGYNPNFYKLSAVTVVDDDTFRLTIPDGTAAGWADSFLGSQETLIVPESTDFSAPAGPGPYRVVSFRPEQGLVLEKNPDYWDADAIHIDRIEMVNAADAQASVLALTAGQVDWAAKLELTLMGSVGPQFTVETPPTPDFLTQFSICKTDPPFSDARVRKALSMAIDRDAINDAVFDGKAEISDGLWPEAHPLHNPDLDGSNVYDVDGAKRLLAEAGYANGFTFDLAQQVAGNAPEISQIVQQQFAAVGVTMNLVPVTNYQVEFLQNKVAPVGISPNVPGRTTARIAGFTGKAISNVCGYSDPELDSIAVQLQKTPTDSDEYLQLWNDFDARLMDQTVSIMLLFRPNVIAYDPEVVQDLPSASYTIPVPEVRAI